MGPRLRLLLDTHALLWWFDGGELLSKRALRAIRDQQNTVLVSAASAWEIAIKAQAGKLNAGSLLTAFEHEVEEEGFVEMPISAGHAIRAGTLPGPHTDPFDRMLAAQAQAEHLAIISKDDCFDRHGVKRIW
jgi:PIN domain nuclease of toxin-antitoxin system